MLFKINTPESGIDAESWLEPQVPAPGGTTYRPVMLEHHRPVRGAARCGDLGLQPALGVDPALGSVYLEQHPFRQLGRSLPPCRRDDQYRLWRLDRFDHVHHRELPL